MTYKLKYKVWFEVNRTFDLRDNYFDFLLAIPPLRSFPSLWSIFKIRQGKKFFKVSTLNLCLMEPEKMQKTRNHFNYPRQRKRPKTSKNMQNSNFAIIFFVCNFGTFSQPLVIGFISSLMHLFRHLETQVIIFVQR